MSSTTKLPPEAALLELITGHWRSCAVHAAAKLGLADVLRDGPLGAVEIAERLGLHAGATHRLLRALASLGVFAERGGRFELTPMADLLRSDRRGSLRSLSLAIGGAPLRAWGELDTSVRSGEPAFDRVHGQSFFAYLAAHEADERAFDEAMIEQSSLSHAAILSAYDFSPFRTIVDIGGGAGALLERILHKHGGPRGVVFDLPQVVAKARARLAHGPLAERLDFVGGDFFSAVPPGGDAYILAMVIHDWSDADAVRILRTVREAMAPGAKILLSELLIPPGNTSFFGKLLDLDMMVNLGGRERTADEYRALFTEAGLQLARFVPAYGPMSVLSIIEGTRA
ncbi:O-methyltransferase [Minicystis rosea]|nr:O-methyltransferase [Minicystis rosea]